MGPGTDTKSTSYIRIMERDICSFKLCPETNLMFPRSASRRQWGSGGRSEASVCRLSKAKT